MVIYLCNYQILHESRPVLPWGFNITPIKMFSYGGVETLFLSFNNKNRGKLQTNGGT